MRIFISWSGDRSRQMAQALRSWIPLVLQSVEPWMSKSDIQAGERWQEAIGNELEVCNFGIICVTPENIEAPWVTFEAGALGKSMEGRVVPLLWGLDLHDVSGPLAQFQSKKADREGIEEVIRGINTASDPTVPDTTIREVFDVLWPKLEQQLASISSSEPEPPPKRPTEEVLEELVGRVRTLDARMRDLQEVIGGPTPRKTLDEIEDLRQRTEVAAIRTFSGRDIDLINLVKRNASMAEIERITDLAADDAIRQLASIQRKLGAISTQHLFEIADRQGLLADWQPKAPTPSELELEGGP